MTEAASFTVHCALEGSPQPHSLQLPVHVYIIPTGCHIYYERVRETFLEQKISYVELVFVPAWLCMCTVLFFKRGRCE